MTVHYMSGWDDVALTTVHWVTDDPYTLPTVTVPALVGSLTNVVRLSTKGNAAAPSVSALAINFLAINTMIGIVPRLVGSATLPAGTYQAPSALLGAGDPAYTATLTLETPTGDVIATVGGVAGGVAWRTASSGFVLAADTAIDLVLVCSAAHQPAFIHGININKV